MNRIIEIEIGSCGKCPFYNWERHKCDKGATDCGGAGSRFYKDCPLKWREVIKENSKMPEKEYIKRAKSEAIKDFAERVKMAFYDEFEELIPSIMADKIDEIVKEMTES